MFTTRRASSPWFVVLEGIGNDGLGHDLRIVRSFDRAFAPDEEAVKAASNGGSGQAAKMARPCP